MAKGRMLPSISFSAGVSTNYYENLKGEQAPAAFGSQFKNNRGEYISFNLSFPLFNGLDRLTNLRKARNNMRIAQGNDPDGKESPGGRNSLPGDSSQIRRRPDEPDRLTDQCQYITAVEG